MYFVVQMTIQGAALKDKELMCEKHGILWYKAAVVYFEFPH
jgi:hypothetical protein